MSQFHDAQTLVEHSAAKLQLLQALHEECLANQQVTSQFRVEVKSFMENLRSALDYCARGLFAKYGHSKKANPNIYFPYAVPPADRMKFRNETVANAIPGLLASRPDIVDLLETYQYFGNTGNWLYLFMRINNENKHEHLTPQVEKKYKLVRISGKIPNGETLKIDLSNIELGGGPDVPYDAIAGTWKAFEFTGTRVSVMLHLEHALVTISRIVDELSAA